MESLTVEFKFDVGEVVVPVLHPKTKMQILSRYVEQCSGGVQIFYHCQLESLYYSRGQKVLRLHEMEIRKLEKKEGEE